MAASQHTIAGTVLTMPVRIRRADVHTALFSVDASAAQRLIDYSGLRVCRYRPGRAVVNLMLARYLDGDLGAYHEFGTAVLVNPPGSTARGWRALASAGAFVHHLPVDQEFTREAGQSIWGFPKIMAEFTIREGSRFGFDVRENGQQIAAVEFGGGLPVPALFGSRTLTAYSHTSGVTREIPWQIRISRLRLRAGGAVLRLGDHRYAAELAALGLPKRPIASATAGQVQMVFGDARSLPD